MHVTLVHIQVVTSDVDAFIEATRDNHLNSTKERGNLRFDLLRDPAHPNRFMLYETYASEAEAKAHKLTPHYLAWREKVEKMMASPRRGVVYDGLLPER